MASAAIQPRDELARYARQLAEELEGVEPNDCLDALRELLQDLSAGNRAQRSGSEKVSDSESLRGV